MTETNYVYIIQEREFVRLDEQTFKIGKTGQNPPWKRFDGYPKGSKVLLLLEVPEKHLFERKIINVFKEKYEHMTDYGNEYFNGNVNEMIQDMISIKHNLENSFVPRQEVQQAQPVTNCQFCKYCENVVSYGSRGPKSYTCANIQCKRKRKAENKRRQRRQ